MRPPDDSAGGPSGGPWATTAQRVDGSHRPAVTRLDSV